MLVITRYMVPVVAAQSFREQARTALETLAGCPGHLRGWVGRATDDPTLWTLTTQWKDVGSYRRALSRYEVKVQAVPLLSRAIDEPTAFEVLDASALEPSPTDAAAGGLTRRAADADTVSLGEASAPRVPTDLDPRQR